MPERALVALSEDRQWLVALDAYKPLFGVYILEDDDYGGNLLRVTSVEDTGQDACQVLAAWLEGRQ